MSNKRFFPLQVASIEKVTPDCSVIAFAIEEELKEVFTYKQGQHLTLKAEIDGEEVRRSYSLCSSPIDGEWKVGIKKVAGGKFSTFANEKLQQGDILEVMPPNGRFFIELDGQKQKHYMAFAAGSGITPIFSIIKTHLLAEPQSTFSLFYINQFASSIILKEEIEALKNLFLDRFELYYLLTKEQRSTPFFNGRLTTEKLDTIFDKMQDIQAIDDFFICGPEDMIFMLRDYLLAKQVSAKRIHFELFHSTKHPESKLIPEKPTNAAADCALTIQEGGKQFTIHMPQGGESILDAALQQGADLPFACKGGVCCTCRAKLIEGQVDMQVNYALEDEEVASGFILTCQAVPLSKKVVVDFDV
ncbi:MAG: 1,2-phenylacetyl-CoA epoxidase subunit PaaE [Saprospiraceae bacterium]